MAGSKPTFSRGRRGSEWLKILLTRAVEYGFGQVSPTALRLEGGVVWASGGLLFLSSLASSPGRCAGRLATSSSLGGGSSTRPTGEWVGQMDITSNYDPVAHTMKAYETQHARALVYMKLEGTDSFMNEYRGSGELILAGDPTRHPLHVGALLLEDSGRISGAFIVPHLTTTADGTYTPGKFQLGDSGSGWDSVHRRLP